MDLTAVLKFKWPTAEFNLVDEDYNQLEWLSEDISKPSLDEINQAKVEYDNHINATAYQRKRAKEYPAFSDQLDMIYHDQMNGTTKWKDMITSIKNKYPKSS